MRKWLILFPLCVIAVLEVWLLLAFGQIFGIFWSIIWMMASFLVGVILLRVEGFWVLVKIHQQLLDEVIPTKELLDMVFIGMGGILLILPGYFTDFLGLSFLIPPLRWGYRKLTFLFLSRLLVTPDLSRPQPPSEDVVDITPGH